MVSVSPDATVYVHRSEPSSRAPQRLRIVHVSDTHDKQYALPDGDVLVHTGDMTDSGHPDELARFRDFIASLPHRHKVLVCGSRETGMDRVAPPEVAARLTGSDPSCHVLHDSEVVIEGMKFYGSPWNHSARAFAMSPEACEIKFKRIPTDTDVLVTHQPPFGVLDIAYPSGQFTAPDPDGAACSDCGDAAHPGGKHWGSTPLRRRIDEMHLPLHLFGRAHHSAGVRQVGHTTFSNGAMEVQGRPMIIDVIVRTGPSPTTPVPLSPVPFAAVGSPALQGASVALDGSMSLNMAALPAGMTSSMEASTPVASEAVVLPQTPIVHGSTVAAVPAATNTALGLPVGAATPPLFPPPAADATATTVTAQFATHQQALPPQQALPQSPQYVQSDAAVPVTTSLLAAQTSPPLQQQVSPFHPSQDHQQQVAIAQHHHHSSSASVPMPTGATLPPSYVPQPMAPPSGFHVQQQHQQQQQGHLHAAAGAASHATYPSLPTLQQHAHPPQQHYQQQPPHQQQQPAQQQPAFAAVPTVQPGCQQHHQQPQQQQQQQQLHHHQSSQPSTTSTSSTSHHHYHHNPHQQQQQPVSAYHHHHQPHFGGAVLPTVEGGVPPHFFPSPVVPMVAAAYPSAPGAGPNHWA